MKPATAVNVADVVPDVTLTEGGTLSNEVLLESATVIPPDPAACVNVTVQLEAHSEFRVVRLQDKRLTDVDVEVSSEMEAVCELPL